MVHSHNLGLIVYVLVAIVAVTARRDSPLSKDYYKKSCPHAEEIIRQTMIKFMYKNKRFGASILRMHFHDCFVDGCDGSILIDSTPSNTAEKDFPANNPSIQGYEIIDAAKFALEKACPGVVSCADILAFAARDGVNLLGGPYWDVRGGRKDGRVSKFTHAAQFLPTPSFNLQQLEAAFAVKNLNKKDLVFLSGGHTVGLSHCSSFSTRLYNFTGRGDVDPALDPSLVQALKWKCPQIAVNGDPMVPMENTPLALDTEYFTAILKKRGILTTDDALMHSPVTAALVNKCATDKEFFFARFVKSMIKMSEIEVKVGDEGEIRKSCRVINY